MTTIMPNGFKFSGIAFLVKSALKELNKSYNCLADTIDEEKIISAKNKLENALEQINKHLKKEI